MRSRATVVASALVIATLARAEVEQPRTLAVSTTRLPNGLVVVVAPDTTVSSVAVHLRFARGVGDEADDEIGYTALVERLLATGTVHLAAGDHDRLVEQAGGFATSAIAADHVGVSVQVPAPALERALWLEAERMAGLADAVNAERLAAARASVDAAYRAAYVDQPYALVAREVQQQLWPAGHGNRRDVLGDGRSLAQASSDRVRAFVRRRLAPSEATLVIAGNVEPARATALAKRYFGWIPKARQPAVAARGASEVAPRTVSGESSVRDPLRQIVIAYRLPAPHSADWPELEVAASILGSGRAAALPRALVDTDRATDVRVEITPQALGSELRIVVTPAPGVAPDRVASAVHVEVDALAREPLAPRVIERGAALLDLSRIVALEGLVFRATALASWHAYTGAADSLDNVRRRTATVTAGSLHRAVKRWLARSAAVTVIGMPEDP